MSFDELVAEIWGELQPASPFCPAAQQFATFAEELYTDSSFSVHQKMLLVTKKYWEYYYSVPKAHHVTGRGHRCIWHVFKEYFDKLSLEELRRMPPLLSVSSPPAQLPPPQIEGLILGEEE